MKTEVLTPEVIEEIPLEKVIDNTLVKHNVTEALINSLKEKYGSLRLRDVEDKESYLEIKDARKEVRKVGILAEKLCKQGREDAIKVQKLWLAKEKEVLGKIDEVQKPLDAEIKKFDDEVERKEIEETNRKEQTYMERQSILIKMGATYVSGNYELGDVSFEVSLIKEADNDMWELSILPKYKVVYEKKEAERIEQERIKREHEEKLKKEREEFEDQQRIFREQQEKFRKEMEEAKRQEHEKQLNEEREKQRIAGELQQKRLTELLPYNPTGSDVNMSTLWTLSESHYQEILSKKKEEYKKNQEEKQKQIAEQAAQAEREKIEREQREAEQKRLLEEQIKQQELEKAGDKVKWQHFIGQFYVISFPEMKSGLYRSKIAQAKEKLEEIHQL